MLYTFFIATTVDFVTHFIYKIHDKEVLCVCVCTPAIQPMQIFCPALNTNIKYYFLASHAILLLNIIQRFHLLCG